MDLTVKLLVPVTFDGEKIEQLTMRELTVNETIALEKSHGSKPATEQDKHFFALTCGVAPDVIGSLGQRDWSRLKSRYWETLGNAALEPETAV